MKKLVHLCALLLVMAGCKKTTDNPEPDPCALVDCVQHAHCNAGVCECDSGWTGANCDINLEACDSLQCGTHGHCINGTCNCDSGWMGTNCSTLVPPANILIGTYRMTGYSEWRSNGDTTSNPGNLIDTVITISNQNISLACFNRLFTYSSPQGIPTEYNYSSVIDVHDFAYLSFHFPFNDDSAFYFSSTGGFGAQLETRLKGKKMH